MADISIRKMEQDLHLSGIQTKVLMLVTNQMKMRIYQVACGIAKYDKEDCVAAVFETADRRMYENKNSLKMRKG